jgi:hypothetical protein
MGLPLIKPQKPEKVSGEKYAINELGPKISSEIRQALQQSAAGQPTQMLQV